MTKQWKGIITVINWIAHRGLMSRYAENTLGSIEAAVSTGAKFVEFDVQIAKDGVPVIIHDDTIDRTTQYAGSVFDLHHFDLMCVRTLEPLPEVKYILPQEWNATTLAMPSGYNTIPPLYRAVDLLNNTPNVTAFVEVKLESIEKFGVKDVADAVVNTMRGARFPWVFLSYSREALEIARRCGARVGYVLPEYGVSDEVFVTEFVPEFAFLDTDFLHTQTELWQGDWKWALYDIMSYDLARRLHEELEVSYLETGCIDEMIEAAK